MEVIGFIGIILGLVVFIFCMAKGINLFISGFLGALVIIITSGGNIIDGITATWAAGFSGFIKSYFLIFVLGSCFGKVLSASGGAKRIARAVSSLCEKGGSKSKYLAALFVPIMYSILSYVGVSGFVIVYTVMDIAFDLFRRQDLPWRMYCYGGATCLWTMLIPGNLQLVNVAAANICGTDVSSGALMGTVIGVIWFIFEIIIIFWDVKRSNKKGEGFAKTGTALLEAKGAEATAEEQNLPSLIQALIPLIVMVILAAVVKWNIIICVAVGIVLCFIVMPGRIKAPAKVVTEGVTAGFMPILGVSAASAVGTCLKASAGYTLINNWLGALPGMLGGCVLIIVLSFCTASSAGGINAVGAEVFQMFTEAGLSAATAHRLMISCIWTSIPPQSSGPSNCMNVAKIKYGDGIWCYIRTNFLGCGVGFVIAYIMVAAGLFT